MRAIPGDLMFNSLKDQKTIIMACNTRITKGVAKGILRAAKELDSAVIFELARSESNLDGGYTGLTPADFSANIRKAAEDVGFDIWALHGDHIGVKKGTAEEIEEIKKLIKAQIEAGYTSFAIDASHLFNFNGKTVLEELSENIRATVELAKFIEDHMMRSYGLEVEVGEIGREDGSGRILTKPEEAVTFIKALNKQGVCPHIIAIANGSAHGNTFDSYGNLVEQVSIDIPQTIAVGKALRDAHLDVTIAQHGITGTPLSIIKDRFPRQYIRKGNVGTHWMNLVWDILKQREPDLYKRIFDWTIENHGIEGKKAAEVFGKNGKFAIKQFFSEIYALSPETEKEIEDKAYSDALEFFSAFNAEGSASIVRKNMK
ncbi:class II fructose-bisphosphate aldolase [Candidatus Woesearchaeota archaeon]|nr:class II fructose-bisphosphate aldolase [Candidatus Woesearchaeota archaeon]